MTRTSEKLVFKRIYKTDCIRLYKSISVYDVSLYIIQTMTNIILYNINYSLNKEYIHM